MATREDQVPGQELGRDPREQFRLQLHRARRAQPSLAGDLTRRERVVGEFARGVAAETTLDYAAHAHEEILDIKPGEFDITDVGYWSGRLLGALPAIYLTGGLANSLIRKVALSAAERAAAQGVAGFAARGPQRVARLASALAARPAQELPFWKRALTSASKNVYEGLAFSLGTAPARHIEVPEGMSFAEAKARQTAAEFGIGAGADFLLGAIMGTAGKPFARVLRRLRESDNALDREMAGAIDARLEALDTEPRTFDVGPEGDVVPMERPQLGPSAEGAPALLPPGAPVSGAARPGYAGTPPRAGLGRGRPSPGVQQAPGPYPRELPPGARFRGTAAGVVEDIEGPYPPLGRAAIPRRTTGAPEVTPAPPGSARDPNLVDYLGREQAPGAPRGVAPEPGEAPRLGREPEGPLTEDDVYRIRAAQEAEDIRRVLGGRRGFAEGEARAPAGKPQVVQSFEGDIHVFEHGGQFTVARTSGRTVDVLDGPFQTQEQAAQAARRHVSEIERPVAPEVRAARERPPRERLGAEEPPEPRPVAEPEAEGPRPEPERPALGREEPSPAGERLLSEDDYRALSRTGRQIADEVVAAENEGQVMQMATEATTARLNPDDRDILEGLIIRRLNELRGKAEAAPEGGPPAEAIRPLEEPEVQGRRQEPAGAPRARETEAAGPSLEQQAAAAYREQRVTPEMGSLDVHSLGAAAQRVAALVSRLQRRPWQPIQRLVEPGRAGPRSVSSDEVREHINFLVEAGFVTRAWDERGLPHYAPRGTDLPEGLSLTSPEAPKAPAELLAARRAEGAAEDLARRGEEARARREEVVPVTERVEGVEGREATIKTGEGENIPARYRVIPADELTVSHNPETFQRNAGYPEGVQPRPYERDPAAQERISTQPLDTDIVLDPTTSPTLGPPQVTPSGVAVGGNDRGMRILRALRADPDRYAAYREALVERAEQFGLDPEQVRGMENPVLVREVQLEGDVSRDELRRLAEAMNIDPQKAKDELAEAATRASRLIRGERALRHLEETLTGDETVRAYLDTRAGHRFLEMLVDERTISPQEASRFRDPNGLPTAEGKKLIEDMLEMAAVGDADILARTPKGIRNKLSYAAPAIIKASSIEGFNVNVALRDGLNLLAEARAADMSLRDLLDQTSIFGAREDSPFGVALARFLDQNGQRKVSTAFREFAADAVQVREGTGRDIFGNEFSFRTSFERIFGEAVDPPPPPGPKLTDDFGFGQRGGFATREVLTHLAAAPAGAAVGGAVGAAAHPEDRRTGALAGAAAGAGIAAGVAVGHSTGALQEMVAMVVRAAEGFRGGAIDARQLFGKYLRRGTDWMDSLGPHGQELARQIRAIDQRASKRSKSHAQEVGRWLRGLGREEREVVAKLINRRESVAGAPAELKERADAIRAILDRDMDEARRLGITRLVRGEQVQLAGSGKAFPQAPNREGIKFLEDAQKSGLAHPRVAAWARQMVEQGKAVDMEDALNQLLRYRSNRLRGVNPYFERTRFELPEDLIEWDPAQVLPFALERNAHFLEGVREWGINFEQAEVLVGRIGGDTESAYAHTIADFISHQFGVSGKVSRADQRLAATISVYETSARLGGSILSALRNAGQRHTNTAHMPIVAQVRAFKDMPPFINRFIPAARKLAEQVEATGAVRSRTAIAEFEAVASGHRVSTVAMKPFTSVERGNQVHTAIVARYALEHDMKKLVTLENAGPLRKLLETFMNLSVDPEGAIRRRVGKMGLSDDQVREMIMSGRRLTEDEIETAMHRLVADTQFPLSLATERIWWSRSPWARLLFKFKTFGMEQTRLVYDQVLKEAVKGNAAPLVKFFAWTLLMGELYNLTRDHVIGYEDSLTMRMINRPEERNAAGVAAAVGRDILDGGGIGMLADLIYGVSDFVVGPAGSTAEALGRFGQHVIQKPSQVFTAARQLAREEISVTKQLEGVWHRIDAAFFDSNSRYFEHRKWRQRTYSWREKKETPEVAARMVDRAAELIAGRAQFPTTERTLSYAYAARAVTNGDVDAAADYLARILDDAENASERAKLLSSIRISMRAKSPLGFIAAKDRNRFLSQFPAQERIEARRLQREWELDYRRAIQRAQRRRR